MQPAHLLRLYDSMEEAVDAAVARPPQLRDELRLAPVPAAGAAARAFVREVCQSWQLARPDETLVERVVLVANELVTTAVVHARTDRGWGWSCGPIGCSSRSVTAARGCCARSPELEAEGGRGLWLVEQLARAWGVRPHPEGGKVAWCALDL